MSIVELLIAFNIVLYFYFNPVFSSTKTGFLIKGGAMKSIKVEIGKRYGKLTIVEELPKKTKYTLASS